MIERIPIGGQILCAVGGLLASEIVATLLVGSQPLWPYYLVATAIGWASIGLPVVLVLSFNRVSPVPWPMLLLLGLSLGPFALAALIVATALIQALLGFGLSSFSIRGLWTGTELLWPMASLISLTAMVVYVALLHRRYR